MSLLEEDVTDLLPLVSSRIHTRGVVGAGVEEEDGLSRGSTEEGSVGLKGESDRLGIVVRVVDRRTPDVREDGLVVGCGYNSNVSKGLRRGAEGDLPQVGFEM